MTTIDWTKAACVGANPETFFPATKAATGKVWEPALTICDSCPIRLACLAYALETRQDFGMWGGLSAAQRALIAPKRDRPPVLKGCGTYAASERHKKAGEPLDDACREARRVKNHEYKLASRERARQAAIEAEAKSA